ncbi:hypothetical protein MBM_06550 [Drepanopeziza brunnea f. sp. 'multigermtubi' MB_m1]|uniref:Uncharacterized protein n=1 Tax=Marssonina brunnea f. sp. multigermtubi (strain MB_m1) TaxID=1072389 RepID=K1XRV9_MARBU|nr:uncharacterized protein MBM_06550 [Drepanopeziza brunnea f. sp. 'multigermtubi' MB_m1]EKD15334.1 hypothetical protein MBM_06550 [Drepanopeziza brunnea f. sp. 'multigermtubi' MB_m1]
MAHTWVTPEYVDLVTAARALRTREPTLERAKFLKRLRCEHQWIISDDILIKLIREDPLVARVEVALPKGGSEQRPADNESTEEDPGFERDCDYASLVERAFHEYTRREREYCLALSDQECRLILELDNSVPNPGDWNLKIARSEMCRFYIQLLMVLKGIKPCIVFYHRAAPDVLGRLIKHVLRPVLEKYGLLSYGFTLQQITNRQHASYPQGYLVDWEGGWMFADTRSSLWPGYILETFLPRVLQTQGNLLESGDRLCKVFGYPVPRYPREEPFRQVRYYDETEQFELLKLTDKVSSDESVSGFGYFDDDGDITTWRNCVVHYLKCLDEMERMGRFLVLDAYGHPELMKYYLDVSRGPKDDEELEKERTICQDAAGGRIRCVDDTEGGSVS